MLVLGPTLVHRHSSVAVLKVMNEVSELKMEVVKNRVSSWRLIGCGELPCHPLLLCAGDLQRAAFAFLDPIVFS